MDNRQSHHLSSEAFQAIIPNTSWLKVTLVAGTVATIAGIFPGFAWKLLGFVGI